MRSKTLVILSVKLALVGLVLAWLYSRSEIDMAGERPQVTAARSVLTTGSDGRTATVMLGPKHAQDLYDLVRASTWALRGSGPPRATFDILYDNQGVDRVEVTGVDRVRVNGSTRSVDGQILQALMLAARQAQAEAPAAAAPASQPE